jgi:hypothetical protein
MSDNYSISVRVNFSVLADSIEEAEEIAKELLQFDNVPRQATVRVDAYYTPNQSDHIKSYAANI